MFEITKTWLPDGFSPNKKCLISQLPHRRDSYLDFWIWGAFGPPSPPKLQNLPPKIAFFFVYCQCLSHSFPPFDFLPSTYYLWHLLRPLVKFWPIRTHTYPFFIACIGRRRPRFKGRDLVGLTTEIARFSRYPKDHFPMEFAQKKWDPFQTYHQEGIPILTFEFRGHVLL